MSICYDWNLSNTHRWCLFPTSRAYFEIQPNNVNDEARWKDLLQGLPKSFKRATTWTSLGVAPEDYAGRRNMPSFQSISSRALTILSNILNWECWWLPSHALDTTM